MKLGKNFITHSTNGEHYIVTTGEGSFNGLIKLNDTADFICECLTVDTTKEQILEKMLEKYDVDKDTAAAAIDQVIGQLQGVGAIDE